MEIKSPPPCPATVTVRRNPPRKARATPTYAISLCKQLSSPSLSRDIFSTEIPENPNKTDESSTHSSTKNLSENLKVFLRIRPPTVQKNSRNLVETKNAWPKNPKIKGNSRPKIKKSCEICVQVNEDMRSVTVSTPQQLQEMKRIKSEIYEGFSHVFSCEASQTDVYEKMVKPLVDDFLKGKNGMLVAMGPSGSGKTHTVFGCAREPGMVPLAIHRIFSKNESTATNSRLFYLSMFEISSEKGKSERMTDLLHDRGEISMQQSVIKGLQEAVVCDAQKAESLIAHGMVRRATAMTNSNSQSSRSQCIINIRCDSTPIAGQGSEVDSNASSPMLTIVDLAGAEREKKTGNQGTRLLESNFINNTSMVFGQCLRSLLEHQRNPNKPLPKHYKNSLLTRYLQDYLEGKKRMALILTVKPGVEDYLDTSFLLRQTSPFTKIKFKTVEVPGNVACNKRPNQALPQAGLHKKMKFSNTEASLVDEGNIDRGPDLSMHRGYSKIARKVVKGCFNQNTENAHGDKVNEIAVLSDGFGGLGIREISSLKGDYGKPNVKKDRRYEIMQGLSKAMWTVLKQYKAKLEGAEMENCHLRERLDTEKARNHDLENELTRERIRLFVLGNELNELKSRSTYGKTSADVFPVSMHVASFNLLQHQMVDLPEVNSEILFYSSRELKKTETEKKTDPSQLEDLLESSDDTENDKGLKDTNEVNVCSSSSQVLSTSANSSQDLISHEDTGIEDMPSRRQAAGQLTNGSVYTSQNTEQDAENNLEDLKNLEQESECVSNGHCFATSLECGNPESTPDYEDLTEKVAVNKVKDVNNLQQESECMSNGPCFATSLGCQSAKSTEGYEDLKDAKQELPTQFEDIPSRKQATSRSTNGSCINHKPEQDEIDIIGGVENLKPESEDSSNGSFNTSLDCEGSSRSSQDSGDLENMPLRSKATSRSTSEPCINFEAQEDEIDIVVGVENLEPESEDALKGSSFHTFLECQVSAKSTQNSGDLENMPCQSEATSRSASGSCINHKLVQDEIGSVGGVENSEPESEDASNGFSFDTSLECEESAQGTQDSGDLKHAKQEQTHLEDNGLLLLEDPTVLVVAHSSMGLNSSRSRCKDDTFYHVDEKQCNHEEGKQKDKLVTCLSEEGSDAKRVPEFSLEVAPCSNLQPTGKPRRRLQPASSVLLKDISLLSIKDENDKPKGGRVGKKGILEDKNRTQGSLSLLNLLTKSTSIK